MTVFDFHPSRSTNIKPAPRSTTHNDNDNKTKTGGQQSVLVRRIDSKQMELSRSKTGDDELPYTLSPCQAPSTHSDTWSIGMTQRCIAVYRNASSEVHRYGVANLITCLLCLSEIQQKQVLYIQLYFIQ